MERLFVVEAASAFKLNTKIENLVGFELAAYGMAKHSMELEPYNLNTVYDWIQFNSGASLQTSPLFDVVTDKWKSFIKVPYADPTYNTWRVKITEDAVSANDVFEVIVAVKDNESSAFPKYESFSVTSKGKSKEKLYAAFCSQLADSEYFDGAVDEGGLVITTVEKYHVPIVVGGRFHKADGKCTDCSTSEVITTELAKWSAGSGSAEEVRELDRKYLPSRGDYSDDYDGRIPRPTLYNGASTKFDLYHLEYANKRSNGGDNGREAFEKRHLLTVAIDVANTNAKGLFEKVVKEALGLTVQVSALQ